MKPLLKDSGLDGLKASIRFCADCGKPTVHYRTPDGWPICYACGYNPDLMKLCALEAAGEHGDRAIMTSAENVLYS
jgi:hypothetical protein